MLDYTKYNKMIKWKQSVNISLECGKLTQINVLLNLIVRSMYGCQVLYFTDKIIFSDR